MAEPTRPRTSKPKSKPKGKPKAAAKKRAPAKSAKPVAQPPALTPVSHAPVQPVAYAQAPSNGLAIASIVCAVAGFTFVPLVGGLAATILGALALKKEREDPEHHTAGGLAVAGLAIGGFTGVLPLLFVTLFAATRITPIPFVLVVGYAAFVFWTATRGRTTTGQKAAILGGSIVMTALAVAASIGLAFGFYYLMRYVSIEIGRAIGDAFGQMFDSIGDAFGSCGDAFKF